MAHLPDLTSMDIAVEIMDRVEKELESFIREKEADIGPGDLPKSSKSRDLDKADLTMMWAQFCAKRKLNPAQYTKDLAQFLSGKLGEQGAGKVCLVASVEGVGPYLNIKLNRGEVFRLTVRAVMKMGTDFGKIDLMKGKKVLIEHTSANPNAPLHIGNLRNVMIGAHLANIMKMVGYDVKQAFYVNDLGAQIGLTALAYDRCYHMLKPVMKVDHWIGTMYAIMNTFSELQKVGVSIGDLGDACEAGDEAAKAYEAKMLAAAGEDEAKKKLIAEYVDIFRDLRDRSPEHTTVFKLVLGVIRAEPNIKEAAGALNLSYERQEPAAIKIFRKMVTDCLSGVQETLDTYGVRHDQWDFESELGWEGSNDKFLQIMKDSPYFVPQTQCNEQGVPQGAYFDFTKFIADMKFKTGKGGYSKEYPPLYVLRPDGSTLYTFRDVVYSFKKASQADLVLNIICSEQDLAQQKVALAMCAMNPELKGRQYHVSYDLVKLTSGKMSGRRGRYLLADDLYSELKAVIVDKMQKRYAQKGESMPEEMFHKITHEVAAGAMKYALLSCSCHVQINFDIAKVTDFEDASAPFILYNSTRLTSLVSKFESKVDAGEIGALPPLDEMDFSLLDNNIEWQLLMEYILGFSAMLQQGAAAALPEPPQLPDYGTHKVCDFLNSLVRTLSSYYGPKGVRILPTPDGKGGGDAMYPRIYFCKALKQVIDNGLRLLMIEPLERM